MTVQELLAEIQRLSAEERLELLEVLNRDSRKTLQAAPPVGVPVERVRGLLNVDAPLPGDQEFKQDYTDYLEAKYS